MYGDIYGFLWLMSLVTANRSTGFLLICMDFLRTSAVETLTCYTFSACKQSLFGRSPLPFFENRKKCTDFGKRSPDCVHLRTKFSIQNVVLRISKRKTSKSFLRNVLRKSLMLLNLPCPGRFPVLHLQQQRQFQAEGKCAIYQGTGDGDFESRCKNHTMLFRHKKITNDTDLSKYLCHQRNEILDLI